jgi:hypothetical protein
MPPESSNESKETFSRFEKLLVALARAKVDYAVVGLAVILNGYQLVRPIYRPSAGNAPSEILLFLLLFLLLSCMWRTFPVPGPVSR